MRRIASHLLAMTLLSSPTLLHATSTIVPDQSATIQGAIDADVDTVFVRAGTYEEALTVPSDVQRKTLLAIHEFPSGHFVHVRGLTALRWVRAERFHFRGPVRMGFVGAGDFEACQFDSGLTNTIGGGDPLTLTGCIVSGGVTWQTFNMRLLGSTFLGGGVDLFSEGTSYVENCAFLGPGAFGLKFQDSDPNDSRILFNVVQGFTDGMIIRSPNLLLVQGNEVRDCQATGFRVFAVSRIRWIDNRATRCGAFGFDLQGAHTVEGCVAESTGLAGIRVVHTFDTHRSRVMGCRVRQAGAHGIDYREVVAPSGATHLSGNTVNHVTGDGIHTEFVTNPAPPTESDSLMLNVTGHCGGHGVSIANPSSLMHVRANTSYLNSGSGFWVQGGPMLSFDRNIGAYNTAFGLSTTTALPLACNDWYGNQSGATSGVAPGPTDLAVSPQFCDAVEDDVRLASPSPLVSAPNCGQIGALGVGCATSTAATPPDLLEDFAASPVPASTRLQFRWRPTGEPGMLEVFDVSGARRWSAHIRAGEGGAAWEIVDESGRPLAPGMYWARLKRGSQVERTRIAIVR